MLAELRQKYPPEEPRIVGEGRQKAFVKLFGAILRMRNLLASYDEFAAADPLSERDLQDYRSRYLDLRDELRRCSSSGEAKDIVDDLVFEMELMCQVDINIDYILMLVEQYRDGHCKDRELLVKIGRAVDSSQELRSKKQLIEAFIQGLNELGNVPEDWQNFVQESRERELRAIIAEENLNEQETRRFMARVFRDGGMKTTGTDLDKMLPPMSRFGGRRAAKKEAVIAKLTAFYEKYKGIGRRFTGEEAVYESSGGPELEAAEKEE